MLFHITSLLFINIVHVVAQTCPIQFDGRLSTNITLSTLDTTSSPFNPTNVFGQNLTWSKIITFPALPPSLFSANTTKPFSISINDASIFAPSSTNIQTGFRRAEFLPASNNGSDPSTVGVKTLHFSIMTDTQRPLNYSHEYQLVFLESEDFSTNQFVLKTGTLLDTSQQANLSAKTLMLFGNVNADPVEMLFHTDFTDGVWHNFGLELDFDQNTTQVLYSQGLSALTNVTDAIPNDISGRGQYHFGVLKKPTGNNLTDITKQGFQETGINEAISYTDIFEENSVGGCVSLHK